MKSVLVTGGAGYIGSHTVLELKNRNITAVVLDNLSTGHREAVHTPHFYEGDISDCGLVKSIIRKHNIDAVIHFAAKSLVSESIEKPELYFRENTIKSCSFFETIIQEGVKHIVFSSTATVYGITGDKPIRETAPLEPVNPYGESKLMIEKYLHWVEKGIMSSGLSAISMRPVRLWTDSSAKTTIQKATSFLSSCRRHWAIGKKSQSLETIIRRLTEHASGIIYTFSIW